MHYFIDMTAYCTVRTHTYYHLTKGDGSLPHRAQHAQNIDNPHRRDCQRVHSGGTSSNVLGGLSHRHRQTRRRQLELQTQRVSGQGLPQRMFHKNRVLEHCTPTPKPCLALVVSAPCSPDDRMVACQALCKPQTGFSWQDMLLLHGQHWRSNATLLEFWFLTQLFVYSTHPVATRVKA